ncbi:hypothetical protein [Saccharothrix lopnurensis]|uniref:Uncharacterized protein n=1 Tax=Saccharothrix lopnurensis TaxID=1670621 RepID=A0ABW1PGF6_9PSEU
MSTDHEDESPHPDRPDAGRWAGRGPDTQAACTCGAAQRVGTNHTSSCPALS